MHKNSISVVICTRDRADMLKCCLRSISESTCTPLEVLVVDQSRNGRTARVVHEAAQTSPFPVRYVHLDSCGLTRARNAGIEASRGQVIAFTDDDCTVGTGWLDAVACEFQDARVTCVCGQTKPADHRDRPKAAMLSTLNHDRRRMVRGRHNPVMIGRGNNMAFRKADLTALGGFNERIGIGTSLYAGDDLDVFYRVMEAGGYMVHAPDAVVHHSQPDDWRVVLTKKRGYSISAAAILSARLRHGDLYAGMLLAGKIAYEFLFLLGGGVLRLNRMMASVGWHSLIGSLSGLKYLFSSDFCDEVNRLSSSAIRSYPSREAEPQPIRQRIL